MNLLFQSPFAEALGWSLIDSLWQMGAIWAVYIIITRNGSRYSSNQRHTLALVATATGTLLFFTSLLLNFYGVVNQEHPYSLAYLAGQHTSYLFNGHSFADAVVPFLSFLYIPAMIFCGLRLLYQVSVDKKSYRQHIGPADANISNFVNEMSRRFSIAKKVAVWMSNKVQSPLTIGFWKPVILLPVALLNQLTPSQLEAVITHELYHIKRNDYLLNIFLTISQVMLFFNPFARLLSAIIRKERENSCDDMVVSMGFDPLDYSQALYILGRSGYQHQMAVAATGIGKEYLLLRIKRILKHKVSSPSIFKPLIAFFLCLFVAATFTRQAKKTADVIPVQQKSVVKAVALYYEEPEAIAKAQTPKKALKKKQPVKASQKIEVIPPAPPPPEAPLPEEEDEAAVITTFVASPQVLEFTIIDQQKPEIPEKVNCEHPLPYVPSSSLYYTGVDTTAGKKVIRL